MKHHNFVEDFVSEKTDPLYSQTYEIDFKAIDQALGFVNKELPQDVDFSAAASGIKHLLGVIVEVAPNYSNGASIYLERIARRALMLAWVIDPGLLEGSPSISEVARKLKINKVVLSIHSAEFSRRFGVRNRAQSHGHNFKPSYSTLSAHTDPDLENDHEDDEHPDESDSE